MNGFGPAHPILAMFITIGLSALAGAVFSLLLAFAAINLKADQTIGGTALNMLAQHLQLCYHGQYKDKETQQ